MWCQTVIALRSSHTKIGVGRLCMLFGRTRHAFYDKSWFLEGRTHDQELVLEMVAEIRREIPRIGTRKLYHMLEIPLATHEIKMGRDMLHTLLQSKGLTVKAKRRYIKTTDSVHWMKKYPNLVKGLTVNGPEQLWVADITYIVVGNDFNFLSLITDAYSKLIVGYCLHPTLNADGPLKALQMALQQRRKPEA